ncbi:hypothetical protein ABI59_18575 [Acidobacteria bacterium Mor1]|nr:hypothetical protein ABI59_18575 [Acidobacteria bacterium Mor1]
MSHDTAQYWNDDAGPRWVRHADALDRQLAPFAKAVLDRAGIQPGQRVLDVGCGAGALSLEAAQQTGAGGRVVSLDVSRTLLELARRRVAAAGIDHVEAIEGDAQRQALASGGFERVVSRFGVMFFDDSEAAFRNLRGGLAAGGSLTFACWGPIAENPWMLVPREVTARHVELPAPEPDAPGPFRFADREALLAMLERAGFAAGTAEPLTGEMAIGGSGGLDGAVEFLLDIGPGAAAREAGPETQRAFADDLRQTLSPFIRDGEVQLGYAAWLVHAGS